MSRTTIRRSAALLVAASLLLVGCSGDEGDLRVGGAPAESAPSATPPSPESEVEPDDQPDDEESGGTGEVEGGLATAAGVSFDIPSGWTSVDPAELAEGRTEALEEAADAVGLTPEELQSTMAGADLVVLSSEIDRDFRNNINVTSPGGALPSAEEAAAQLETAGATISDSGTVETDAGEAITVDYELPVGAASVQGTAIGVDNDGELVLITVSTLDADTTDEIATAITDSLAAE